MYASVIKYTHQEKRVERAVWSGARTECVETWYYVLFTHESRKFVLEYVLKVNSIQLSALILKKYIESCTIRLLTLVSFYFRRNFINGVEAFDQINTFHPKINLHKLYSSKFFLPLVLYFTFCLFPAFSFYVKSINNVYSGYTCLA